MFTPTLSYSGNYSNIGQESATRKLVNQDLEEIRELKAQFNEVKRLNKLELR